MNMNTSLHIALCDSNPGDRYQMERLLSRESDRRTPSTGAFYIDTFGSMEAILKSNLVYDLYILDFADLSGNAYDIATAIRNKGILSPIVFCISTIDYRNLGALLSNSVFMNKPIKTNELNLILDEIITQKLEDYIPTIELRNNYEAYYVTEKEVMYFSGRDYSIDVHYVDGRSRKATTIPIINLRSDLEAFKSFYMVSKNAIINTSHIKEVGLASVTMEDGCKIKIPISIAKELRRHIAAGKSLKRD